MLILAHTQDHVALTAERIGRSRLAGEAYTNRPSIDRHNFLVTEREVVDTSIRTTEPWSAPHLALSYSRLSSSIPTAS